MVYTWSAGAAAVLKNVEDGWAAVWSLLFAATKATFRLSLQVPLDLGAELAYAAMDLCEARDEVGWVHPELPLTAIAVDLGPVEPVLDVAMARSAIVDLLDGLLRQLTMMRDGDGDPSEGLLARAVTAKVAAAHHALTDLR